MLKFIVLCSMVSAFSVQAETVTLNFSNLGSETGQLAVAVFSDPDAFPDQASGALLTAFYPLNTPVTLDLKPGHYALATYLDANMNRRLDKNIIGIPKERFGFSKNPRVTTSAPNFSECEFEVVEGKDQELFIRLVKFL